MNQYREGKVKNTPTGSEIVPETVRLQPVGADLRIGDACLLHNEPTSYTSLARLRLTELEPKRKRV